MKESGPQAHEIESRSVAESSTDMDDATFTQLGNLHDLDDLFEYIRSPIDVGSQPPAGLDTPYEKIGRYLIQRKIGRGGFADVYLASDPLLGRDVAIKVPRSRDTVSADFAEEARRTAAMNHPGIVTVHDVGNEHGRTYVVMEFVPGRTMESWINELHEVRKSRGVWPVPPEDQLRWFLGTIAESLNYAHSKGFVHRDLKPSNILIDERGNPHISDFGLAIIAEHQSSTRRQIAGTPPYMSPEQVDGELSLIDHRSDIWSLGVILFEFLTGKRPFGDQGVNCFQSIKESSPDFELISDGVLKQLCESMLSKEPYSRPQTASIVAEVLRTGEVTPPQPDEVKGSPHQWLRMVCVIGIAVWVTVVGLLYSESLSSFTLDIAGPEGERATPSVNIEPRSSVILKSQSSDTLGDEGHPKSEEFFETDFNDSEAIPLNRRRQSSLAISQRDRRAQVPLPQSPKKNVPENSLLSGQEESRTDSFVPSAGLPGTHHNPVLGFDDTGNAIVAWQTKGSERDGWEIYYRIIDSNGLRSILALRANEFATNDQISPVLVVHPDGRFVIAWTSHGQDKGGAEGVYARWFNELGKADGPEKPLHIIDVDNQSEPAVALADDGTLWASWTSYNRVHWADVFMRQFDSSGNPLTDELLVNSSTRSNQSTSVIMAWNDVVAVAFQGENGAGALYDIYLRMFKTGVPQGSDLLVNTNRQSGTWGKRQPEIAGNGIDQFVVVWGDNHDHTPQDGNGWGTFGQLFTAEGQKIGGEFQVNQTIQGFQGNAAVAMTGEGRFVVAWSNKDGTDRTGVYLRHFSANGTPETPEIPIAIAKDGHVTDIGGCCIAVDTESQTLLLAWSEKSNGDDYHIQLKRLPVTEDE